MFVGLARLFAGLTCPRIRGCGGIKLRLQLGYPRFPFVELRVERTHLPKVATLECGKSGAKIDKLQLALGEGRADGRQLLALAEDFLLFGFQPPDDLT
jgi:hypothetical protein